MVSLTDPESPAIPYGTNLDTLRAHVACRYLHIDPPILHRKQLTALHISPHLTLSVPVAGGNRQLRALEATAPSYHDLDQILLSEHDNWRRRHLAALQAHYATLPYYIHFASNIERPIRNAQTLGELLRGIAAPLDLLINTRLLDQLTKWRESKGDNHDMQHPKIPSESPETSDIMHNDTPWLETLFRHGPAIIFKM